MSTNRNEIGTAESQRRGNYPYYSLTKSLEIGDAVSHVGGNAGDVPKSLLAQRLGVEENSASLSQLIGSAKAFGIVEGRGNISLTPDATRYFYPADESEKRHAQLAFLAAPTVFEKLLKKYDGTRLPGAEMLANLINRDFDVPASWKQRVASLFLSSVRDADLVDGAGILRYEAAKHGKLPATSTKTSADPMPRQEPQLAPPQLPKEAPMPNEANVWVFSMDGQTVRLETPSELSISLWNKLQKYVEVLKPSESD